MDEKTRTLIEGMELAMRVCRNRHQDCMIIGQTIRANEATVCEAIIRLVQVEIGSGRMPLPTFTPSEINEMDRIS